MAPETKSKRGFYYGWVIVAVAFIVISLVSPLGPIFQLFYQALKDQFQWSHASISGVYSVHQLINGMASPLVGWLLDRFGPRRMMPLGALILGLALAASSQIMALWQLYLIFGVIAALGVSMLQSVPNTVVISNWFVRNRGAAIGLALSGSGLGQLALTPLTQWMIVNYGWRAAYLALAPLLLLVPLALVLAFLHHRPSDKGLSVDGESEWKRQKSKWEVVVLDKEWAESEWTLKKAMCAFRFWVMALMTFAFAASFFLISSQLFVLTQEVGEFQASSIIVAFIIGAAGLYKGVAKFIGGVIADRLGREKTATIGVGLILIGIFTLDQVQAHPSSWLLLAATLLYGTGYGVAMLAIMAAYADLFQGARFGSILGVLTLVGLIGGAMGTGLGGYLRDLTGGYQFNLWTAAIGFAAAVALMWGARPSRVRSMRKISKGIEAVGVRSAATESHNIG